MLIAQAMAEPPRIITIYARLATYGVSLLSA
jgi:hypothetical protein